MIVVNYIVLALLAIAFVVLAVGFLMLITRNMRQGRVVRQHLARRVESLRMSRLLNSLGIDFSKYLHIVPISKINDTMNKCETCLTSDYCDEQLAKPNLTIDNIDYCPNSDCLRQFHEMEKNQA